MNRHRHFYCLVPAFLLLITIAPGFCSSISTLDITDAGNVSYVTISNPPINLYDAVLSADLYAFLSSLDPSNRTTPPPKVVVFRSADPEIFIAHLDLTVLLLPSTPEKLALLSQYVAVTRLLQSLTTTVFIAEVDGNAFGAGNELIVQMDLRFAGPNARVGSLETSIGSTHAAGGMQFLGRLINRGRALQYLLSGDTVGCKLGEELGWFNGCFKKRSAMEKFVDALAKRIALRPAGALNATKAGLTSLNPAVSVLDADATAFGVLSVSAEAQSLTEKFLELGRNQTRSAFELHLDDSLAELYE